MSKAEISLSTESLQHFEEYFPSVVATLKAHFRIVDLAASDAQPDAKAALDLASALEGMVLSSDSDCAYFPCVVGRPDQPVTLQTLHDALGIGPDEMADHVDGERPRLRFDGPDISFFLTISRLDESELEDIGEYLDEREIEQINAAGALPATSKLAGLHLSCDAVTTIRFCLAEQPTGKLAGILAARVDT